MKAKYTWMFPSQFPTFPKSGGDGRWPGGPWRQQRGGKCGASCTAAQCILHGQMNIREKCQEPWKLHSWLLTSLQEAESRSDWLAPACRQPMVDHGPLVDMSLPELERDFIWNFLKIYKKMWSRLWNIRVCMSSLSSWRLVALAVASCWLWDCSPLGRLRGGEEEGRAGISRQVGALISPADPAFQHEYWSGQYTLLAVRSRQSLRQAQLSHGGFPSLTFTFTRLCGGELPSDIWQGSQATQWLGAQVLRGGDSQAPGILFLSDLQLLREQPGGEGPGQEVSVRWSLLSRQLSDEPGEICPQEDEEVTVFLLYRSRPLWERVWSTLAETGSNPSQTLRTQTGTSTTQTFRPELTNT